MGCMSSKPVDPADKEALQQTSKIDRMIKTDKKRMDRTIKILLLGMCFGHLVDDVVLRYLIRRRGVGQINNHKADAHYPLARFSGG